MCLSAQSKGAKEKIVTRIIVSRCEVDLKKVCSEYKATFGESVQKTIMVSEVSSLPLTCYRFTVRFVVSRSNLLCFCRNTPRETTRRCCWALSDQSTKNEPSVSKGAPERWAHEYHKLCSKKPILHFLHTF